MRTIIVGFSRPKALFVPYSLLIRAVDHIDYSHVYLKFHSDHYDCNLIYQASHVATNFYNESYFDAEEIVVKEFKIEVSDEIYDAAMKYSIDHVGAPYGVKQVVGIACQMMFGDNPFKDGDKSYVCSELVQDVMKFPIDQDPDNIRPIHIYQYLEKIYG